MAIIKQAKNIEICVAKKHKTFVGKRLEKIASELVVDASKGNLFIQSTKKVFANGNGS
jgi:hypothetical protein